MSGTLEIEDLRQRVDELEERFSRSTLGGYEHEDRIDCTCTQNLAMRDRRTGAIRFGYSSLYAYIPAGSRFALSCKRCKRLIVVGARGEVEATVDPAQLLGAWKPGEPLPTGLLSAD